MIEKKFSLRRRLFLLVLALLLVGGSLLYTNYLATKLKRGEEQKVKLYIEAWNSIQAAGLEDDVTFQTEILSETDVPIIFVNEFDEITNAQNFEPRNDDSLYLARQLQQIKSTGQEPIKGFGYADKIYYKNTLAYRLLNYFPYVQLSLLAIFIGVSYLVLKTSQLNEQNQIWVGMSKETAHQLGTPLTAIVAWLELLKMKYEDDEETLDTLAEMGKDIDRLKLVSERFSKIGSEPELTTANIYDLVLHAGEYMEKRAPRKVTFEYPKDEYSLFSKVNVPLFEWVLENLIRNALDSLDGKGKIICDIYGVADKVYIDISDTGVGMPSSKHEKIFKPGYSTKKRGWGLGLSLSRRIVEKYHAGSIYVKKSSVGEGATFTIELPLLHEDE